MDENEQLEARAEAQMDVEGEVSLDGLLQEALNLGTWIVTFVFALAVFASACHH